MAQDIIEQLHQLCDRLRQQLMQQPEYRALLSLEKTIEDISACTGAIASALPQDDEIETSAAEIAFAPILEPMDDRLEEPMPERNSARPGDHLPSHRVA